jgi:medium-chain acyl-[acyl-carrier-protein] hydrolase
MFCFPYAGGNASTYAEWDEHFPNWLEVTSVQLPGRGGRFREMPFTRIEPLVDSLLTEIKLCSQVPFLFFGHSMGGHIAFELARKLMKEKADMPKCLCVSAAEPPVAHREDRLVYKLPKVEFLKHLRRLNGMPAESFENDELIELLLPTLRADFELTGTYEYHPGAPLNLPIVAFAGTEDHEVPSALMAEWGLYTTDTFQMHSIPGDHFFVNHSSNQVRHILQTEIAKLF